MAAMPFAGGFSRHPRYYGEPGLSDDDTIYDSEEDMAFLGRRGHGDLRMPYGATSRRRQNGAHRIIDGRRYGGPYTTHPIVPDDAQYFPDLGAGNQMRPYGGGGVTTVPNQVSGYSHGSRNAPLEHHHHHHHYVYNCSNPAVTAGDSVPRRIECRRGYAPPMLDHYPRNSARGPGGVRLPALPAGSGAGGGAGGIGIGIGRHPGVHSPGELCGCDCCIAVQYSAAGGGPPPPLGRPGMGMQSPRVPMRSTRLLGL